jgi:integrase
MTDADWRKQKRKRDGGIRIISGKIYARIQYLDEVTGKRKEKLKPARNRTEARELVKEMRNELNTRGQEVLEADKITFSAVTDRYARIHLIPAIYQNGIKVAGKRSLTPSQSSLKPVLAYFGWKAIRSIRPSDIEAYKIARLASPVVISVNRKILDDHSQKFRTIKESVSRPRKIASVNRELELLRAIFNFAKGEDLVSKSPFETRTKLISTSAELERDRVMSLEEEQRLLGVCVDRKAHLRPLIIAAVDTGMRRGELFKLRWRDVNLGTREILIQASNAKTERMRRVGLTNRSTFELMTLWNRGPKDPDDRVFGITSTIKTAWKSACDEAGITDLRFHDLRHTATTRMVRSGVPASEVMKLTGHTQTKTFLRYLNLTSESLSSSAGRLDAYLVSFELETSGPVNDLVN